MIIQLHIPQLKLQTLAEALRANFLLLKIFVVLGWFSPSILASTDLIDTSATSAPIAPHEIFAAVHEDTYEKFRLGKYDDICRTFDPENHDQIYRIIVDLMIFCEALIAVEYEPKVILIPSPNYSRSLRFVESGAAHTTIDSVWIDDIKRLNLRATNPVLHKGEFEKGLFTIPGHPLLTAKNKVQALNESMGVTFKNWKYDTDIMLGLTDNVVFTNNFDSLFRMLYAKRVDFTFLEFPHNENQTFELNGKTLSCVQGVKVLIPEARAFVVSEKAPEASALFNALNEGIEKLQSQGRIRAMYMQYGIVNAQVEDWVTLNPLEPEPTQTQQTNN